MGYQSQVHLNYVPVSQYPNVTGAVFIMVRVLFKNRCCRGAGIFSIVTQGIVVFACLSNLYQLATFFLMCIVSAEGYGKGFSSIHDGDHILQ